MNISFFYKGLSLGFLIAAPVGPIGLLCIRRTLATGQIAGLVSGLGAATADAIYGAIAGFGLTLISSFLVNQQIWLRVIGGGFLCYLGVKIFLAQPTQQAAESLGKGLLGNYASTFFLTLTNPMTILSFAGVFAGLGIAGGSSNYLDAAILVFGVFLGSALWWLLLSSSVNLIREKLSDRLLILVNKASGLMIFIWGFITFSFSS
ncbi:MAG: LysE family translocator [Actinomycetota bacterium]